VSSIELKNDFMRGVYLPHDKELCSCQALPGRMSLSLYIQRTQFEHTCNKIVRYQIQAINVEIFELWIEFDKHFYSTGYTYVLDIPCNTFLVDGHDPVPDSALTASSFYDNNDMLAADIARLNSPSVSGISVGSWSAATNNLDVKYIPVTFSALAERCNHAIIIFTSNTHHIYFIQLDGKTLCKHLLIGHFV